MEQEGIILALGILRLALLIGFTAYLTYFITRSREVSRLEKAIFYFMIMVVAILLINGELLEDAPKQRRDKPSETLQQQPRDVRMWAENRVYRRDAAHEFHDRQRS